RYPVAYIEVVNVLLANVIAAQPDVVVPIANLPFQIGISVIATVPDRPAVDPIGAQVSDFANHAVLDSFDGFDVAGAMASLGTGGHLEAFLLRFFVSGENLANARS